MLLHNLNTNFVKIISRLEEWIWTYFEPGICGWFVPNFCIFSSYCSLCSVIAFIVFLEPSFLFNFCGWWSCNCNIMLEYYGSEPEVRGGCCHYPAVCMLEASIKPSESAFFLVYLNFSDVFLKGLNIISFIFISLFFACFVVWQRLQILLEYSV